MTSLIASLTEPQAQGVPRLGGVVDTSAEQLVKAAGGIADTLHSAKVTGDVRRGLQSLEGRWQAEEGIQRSLQTIGAQYQELESELADPEIEEGVRTNLLAVQRGLDKARNALSQDLMTPTQYQTAVNMLTKSAIAKTPGLTREIAGIAGQYARDPVTFIINDKIKRWEESVKTKENKDEWNRKRLLTELQKIGIFPDYNTDIKQMEAYLSRVGKDKEELSILENEQKIAKALGAPDLRELVVKTTQVDKSMLGGVVHAAYQAEDTFAAKEEARIKIHKWFDTLKARLKGNSKYSVLDSTEFDDAMSVAKDAKDLALRQLSNEEEYNDLKRENDIAVQNRFRELDELTGGVFLSIKAFIKEAGMDSTIATKDLIDDAVEASLLSLHGDKNTPIIRTDGNSNVGHLRRLLKENIQNPDKFNNMWKNIAPLLNERALDRYRRVSRKGDRSSKIESTTALTAALDSFDDRESSQISEWEFNEIRPIIDNEVQTTLDYIAKKGLVVTQEFDDEINVSSPDGNGRVAQVVEKRLNQMLSIQAKDRNIKPKKFMVDFFNENYGTPEAEEAEDYLPTTPSDIDRTNPLDEVEAEEIQSFYKAYKDIKKSEPAATQKEFIDWALKLNKD